MCDIEGDNYKHPPTLRADDTNIDFCALPVNPNDLISTTTIENTDLCNLSLTNDESSSSPPNIEVNEKLPDVILKNLKMNNENNIIIAHLNINFLQNKFEALRYLIQNKVDVLVISETKIDDSFPLGQFMLDGYSAPFRKDRNNQGGGVTNLYT